MSAYRTYTIFPLEGGREAALISDLKAMNAQGQKGCVSKIIAMLADLRESGQGSRFLKHLGGPLWELKARVRDGGARVYLFRVAGGAYAVGRAECKDQDAASEALLVWVSEAYRSWQAGQRIFAEDV